MTRTALLSAPLSFLVVALAAILLRPTQSAPLPGTVAATADSDPSQEPTIAALDHSDQPRGDETVARVEQSVAH
jgi:hypothetical protein